MSVPNKNTTWGELLYKGKIYGVLDGFHLSKDILDRYNQYKGDKGCTKSTAPWRTIKVNWTIEYDKLYLTRLCRKGLLTELLGSEKILVNWIDDMKLLKKHRKVCKTYEKKNTYLNEMEILHLSFIQGNISRKRRQTEHYISIEMKNYIDRNPSYATIRIDSMGLLDYMENRDTIPVEDQTLPIMLNSIDQMIQEGSKEDITLSFEDVKTVLKEGESAVFASAKGDKIEDMVDSLVDSMTEGVIKAKGCLLQFSANKDFHIENFSSLVSHFEKTLAYDRIEPIKNYMSGEPFIFGINFNEKIHKDNVLIRVLLSI